MEWRSRRIQKAEEEKGNERRRRRERAGFVCRRCLHKCLLFLLLPLSLLPGWLPSPHKMGGVVRPRKFFASLLCKIEWAQDFGIGCPQQMICPCAGRANFFEEHWLFRKQDPPGAAISPNHPACCFHASLKCGEVDEKGNLKRGRGFPFLPVPFPSLPPEI